MLLGDRCTAIYYIHFKITGDPHNLIGSQRCDLLRIALFFVLNHICSKSHYSCSKSHHFCLKFHRYFCFISRHFCFKYKTRYVKAFLFPLFNKPAT